jgi:hypothetical protein
MLVLSTNTICRSPTWLHPSDHLPHLLGASLNRRPWASEVDIQKQDPKFKVRLDWGEKKRHLTSNPKSKIELRHVFNKLGNQ